MTRAGSAAAAAASAVATVLRRPLALTVLAVVLAVLGASTIGYAVTRPDANHPPTAAGVQDSSGGVPAPVLPAAAAPTPAAPTPGSTSTGQNGTVPAPLPTAPLLPLLPTDGSASARPTRTSATPTATPKATRTSTATPGPTASRKTTPPRMLPAPLSPSAPVRVVIHQLGVNRKPIGLGLTRSGALQVPDNAEDLGWYTGGPTPGAIGSAVIAGHVSYNKPGVFYGLATLQRGDVVEVTRKDGRTAVFTVSGTRTYPKDKFPTADVYGFVDRAALRLITCGGDYDAKTRHFEENVVVYADMTSVSG